jgi:metal-responsive CopG/Arc/MetJ family transcriptional regulator
MKLESRARKRRTKGVGISLTFEQAERLDALASTYAAESRSQIVGSLIDQHFESKAYQKRAGAQADG